MSVFTNRPALRWLVPVAAAAVVIGGGAAIGTLSANAEPALPPRSAAQLLVDLQTAQVEGFSGTVVQRADLGLPALAGIAGSGSSDLTALASGTHTLRVWYAGPDKARVALLGTLGESDIVRNGADVWTWRSQSNEATHHRLPAALAGDEAGHTGGSGPAGLPSTPQEAADRALAAIDPSTEVTVGRSATIAGRDAYELVLQPRDAASLVGQVRIAIDAEEHLPLRFELFAEGSEEPAFELAFTQVDFNRPGDSQFTFNPPPGTKVTESTGDRTARKPHDSGPAADSPTTVGTGWTTVLVGRVPAELAAGKLPAADGGAQPGNPLGSADVLGNLLGSFPKVSGDWGSGRLFTTKLVNVLLLDDGRVLAGAVTPQRLYEVAAVPR
ncbi:outer membrane lipoprotein carrier protein LolA [Micromonospora sp. NBC_01699]|uniref:LolA family protein n=1 Tax=Micromonospora sp. NBC_01699 TaxID=2975984 RepID=UPI002E34744B|nr:outer membrane lipoprotein carrier protein LolA [Micromonospora sp. NBC_01699]